MLVGCGRGEEVVVVVMVEGLLNPVGVEVLPAGHILVAEEGTGEQDDSAGVSVVLADGRSGRLISGLPSGRDSGDLSGVPFVKVYEGVLYTSYFKAGRLLTLPFDVEDVAIPAEPFGADDMGEAMVPLNAVALINPFDITFSAEGLPVVSDASGNGVAMATTEGQTRFFHRFEALVNPSDSDLRVEAVPTGVVGVDDGYVVTLTGGCPYPAGVGQVVKIDENRQQEVLVEGLNMPIDVIQAEDGTLWVLEFAQFDPAGSCFSGAGYLPYTGRLSRLDGAGNLEPVLTELNFPGSVAFGEDGTAYVSEIFSGRVLRISHLSHLDAPLSVTDVLPPVAPEPTSQPPATPTPPSTSGVDLQFRNVADEVGLTFQHGAFATEISADPVAMMGGGLCWLDYDNDGWLDLYVVNSHALAEVDYWLAQGGLPHNHLYRNVRGQFVDVSAGSGADLALRGNGCVAGDFDNDGWVDLFVTADGGNRLLWNEGEGVFVAGGDPAGQDIAEWNSAAAVGDVNSDGWLDLFVAAYIDLDNKIPNPSGAFPQDFYGLADRFYINNGDRTFTDVTEAVGLVREERGLGAVLSDLDGDGQLDLYVANDGHPNRLYLGEGTGADFRFMDVSLSAEAGDSGSGMGIARGDYDNDGLFDLLVTNWDTELNALYRNELAEAGVLRFRYSTFRIGMQGLGNNMTGWGTTWADFDHDLDEDLLVVNGHVPITDLTADAQLVRLYWNRLSEGLPGQLREGTMDVGLGMEGVGPLLARGSAVADFDNDGDLDVAVNVIGGRMVLLRNERSVGNWLMVDGVGFRPGTLVQLRLADGQQLVRELNVGSSYLASEDPRLHFGLGEFEVVEEVMVSRPGYPPVYLPNIPANQHLFVTE